MLHDSRRFIVLKDWPKRLICLNEYDKPGPKVVAAEKSPDNLSRTRESWPFSTNTIPCLLYFIDSILHFENYLNIELANLPGAWQPYFPPPAAVTWVFCRLVSISVNPCQLTSIAIHC